MSLQIPESDWRRFKDVRAKLLQRYCARVLGEVVDASRASQGSAHDRYLKVFKLIQERDKHLAQAFDGFRRSTAVIQLATMRRMELLTDSELAEFSEPVRIWIEQITSL